MNQDSISQQYLQLVTERKQLPNIYRFANWTNQHANDLKQHFPNHESILAHLWKTFLDKTITTLFSDPEYHQYAAYEKLLAFHYVYIQVITEHRSLFQLRFKSKNILQLKGADLKLLKESFLTHAKVVTKQGKTDGELADRILISDKLDILLWYQFLYILRFWAHDESTENTLTDAAIEKSTQWVFEVLSRNLLDNSFDFAKFFVQNLPFKF